MYSVLNVSGDTKHCGNLGHVVDDFAQACSLAKKYGFQGINIDVKNDDLFSLEEKKELLAEFGLIPAASGSPLKLYENNTLQEFEESLKVFEKEAKSLQFLGCRVVLCYVPPFSEQLNFNDYFILFSNRLKKIKSILGDHELKLGLEFIGPTETRLHSHYDFIHTIDGVRSLIASADLYGLAGIKLDIHHWANSGAGLLDLKHLDREYILYVELNDGLKGYDIFHMPEFTRELPSTTGTSDLNGFLSELKEKNYEGPICIEPWNEEIKNMSLEKAIKTVKDSLDTVLLL